METLRGQTRDSETTGNYQQQKTATISPWKGQRSSVAGVTWPGTKVALELWGDMQLLEEMLSEAQREGGPLALLPLPNLLPVPLFGWSQSEPAVERVWEFQLAVTVALGTRASREERRVAFKTSGERWVIRDGEGITKEVKYLGRWDAIGSRAHVKISPVKKGTLFQL